MSTTPSTLPTSTTSALPPALDTISRALPVIGALARLIRAGSPRWSYTVLATDVVGPWRSERQFSPAALRGLPAVPAGEREVPAVIEDTGTHRSRVWGTRVVATPARPAEPALAPLLRRVGHLDVLEQYVEALDLRAGVVVPGEACDAPEGWTVARWRGSVGAQVPPPLRRPLSWPTTSGQRGVVESSALAGVPRRGPAASVADDVRLEAVRVLVGHARTVGVVDERDVTTVVEWIVGPTRAVPGENVVEDADTGAEWRSRRSWEAVAEAGNVDPSKIVLTLRGL